MSAILGLIVSLLPATIATAAPAAKQAENRNIAARDAAIEKISAIHDRLRLCDRQWQVYVAYGSIDPKVLVPACIAIRASRDKKAEQAENDLRFEDRQEDLRQTGKPAPEERGRIQALLHRTRAEAGPFAEATRQAQQLLSPALNMR
jgi:hypothetical protein